MIFTQTWSVPMGANSNESVKWLSQPRDFESSIKDQLPVLYRVAKRMGCTNEEAEDVVQMTIVKAFRAWNKFDGQHLRSWLIRILRNERLMTLRSKDQFHSSLDESEQFEIPDEPFWEDLSFKIQAESVLKELEKLPDIYKMTIHLCDVEELTYEEAAESMDIPVGTVRSRLFRARAMLRENLAPYIDLQPGGVV